MKKRATLEDVARLAGVSVVTASRVLNGHAPVSESTARRVWEAVDKLGYIPHIAARGLATGVFSSFLLLMIEESPILPSTWRHELPIIQGICDFVRTIGYSLQIEIGFKEEVESPNFLRPIGRRPIDGLLILSPWPLGEYLLRSLQSEGIPFVCIGCGVGLEGVDSVDFDNFGAFRALTEHLIALGHRRIALISGYKNQLHMIERIRGFVEALKGHGLEVCEELIKFGDFTVESGYQCMKELLREKPRPTAVMCGNDHMAAGAIRAIREAGFDVPEDFSVTGFDNNEVAEATNPQLTTVEVPLFRMGWVGAEKLYNLAQSGKNRGQEKEKITKVVLPCEMVVRSSTGRSRGSFEL